MTVRDVRMMVCDACETRFDLPNQSWSDREAREYAQEYGWTHELGSGDVRIDLCEPCSNNRADLFSPDDDEVWDLANPQADADGIARPLHEEGGER